MTTTLGPRAIPLQFAIGFLLTCTSWLPEALGAPGDIAVISAADPDASQSPFAGDQSRLGGYSVSQDGRYVAFYSYASNLVAGDTNSTADVFVRDTQTGSTTRVSVDGSGVQGNRQSVEPAISANGRYVAFYSTASNLVAGDTNDTTDVFVRDIQSGSTARVSVNGTGAQGSSFSLEPTISSDGRYVAFRSYADNLVSGDTNGRTDVFVRDTLMGITTRISVAGSGVQGNHDSSKPAISADGRYVAFQSSASNLVAGDTNGAEDVFVRDTQMGTTTRVSVDASGVEGNTSSFEAAISTDGRYVAFGSRANNLVAGDTNGTEDVFVRDTLTGTTTRVSVNGSGAQGNSQSREPAISADGRYVTFNSSASNLVTGDTGNGPDVFVRDTLTGTTTRVSVDSMGMEGDHTSFEPAISADGRHVAFTSLASNLAAGDTNGIYDVFLRDTQTNVTAVVSVRDPSLVVATGIGPSFNGRFANSVDGRYVAFSSYASNLVAGDTNGRADVFVRDRETGTTTLASVDRNSVQGNSDSSDAAISADGRYVAFRSRASNLVAGDSNGWDDVFVRDIQTGITTLVSANGAGEQGDGSSSGPTISPDGRYVAFQSRAGNLAVGDPDSIEDVFVRDTQTGTTRLVSTGGGGVKGDGSSSEPAISADGRHVAFQSGASNLVAGDTNAWDDVFVRDTHLGTTTRVSVNDSGVQGDSFSSEPAISANGRYVTFHSGASNLVAGDTNGVMDVFVRDTLSRTTTRVSVDGSGAQANNASSRPAISADGRYVAFYSDASNLVAGDTNASSEVFVRDTQTGTIMRVAVDGSGVQANGASFEPAISANGRYVAFSSDASNLADDDNNSARDVFQYELDNGSADETSPRVTPAIQGNLGINGWYVSNVTVSWVVTDAESAVTGQTGCEPVTITTDTAGETLTCSATSEGGTATESVTIRRDATAPVVSIRSPADGEELNEGSLARADYECTDALAGIRDCMAPVADGAPLNTSEPGSGTFHVRAMDLAGNIASATHGYTVVAVAVDSTAPVVTADVAGTTGAADWYVDDVTVTWTVSDAESPVANETGCDAMIITTDTSGQTLTCTATSQGGTTSESVTIKRDSTAPVVSIVSPADGAEFDEGSLVVADYECADATAGILTCIGPETDGEPLDTSVPDAEVFVVTATDLAGNTGSVVHGYTVVPVVTVQRPIISQGPRTDDEGQSLRSNLGVGETEQQVAEDFVLSFTASVQTVGWEGSYFGTTTPNDCDSETIAFRIRFYESPSEPPISDSDVSATCERVGTSTYGSAIYRFAADLGSALPLPAGAYWVSIVESDPDTSIDFRWWKTNTEASGQYAVRSSEAGPFHVMTSDPRPDFALTLSGELVSGGTDGDADGVTDDVDNCPAVPNPDQADLDEDGVGDACDPDDGPIIFQGPRTDDEGQSLRSNLGASETAQQVADDFLLSSPVRIQNLSWEGSYFATTTPNDCDSETIAFRIRFYQSPDEPPNSDSDVHATCVRTGTSAYGSAIYHFDAELGDGVTLSAGAHWISIVENDPATSIDFRWWKVNSESAGQYAYRPSEGGPFYVATSDSYADFVLSLFGETQPEDADGDSDGVPDTMDNCPTEPNADQADLNGDAAGDVCDPDDDGDGVDDAADNCPLATNLDQQDLDNDGLGSACDDSEDVTPPQIQGDVAGTRGSNGWDVDDVTVTWTVSDPDSPVLSQTGCDTVTITTDTTGETLTCSATSEGGPATESVTIKRDATAPSVAIVSPADGAEFDEGSSVLADYECADGTAGVATCTGSVTDGAPVDTSVPATGIFTVTATDSAGNTTSVTHGYTVVPVDVTPPVISADVAGPAGNAGWYVGDVTVIWTVSDPESAVLSRTGCDTVTITTDTAGETLTCSAASEGGPATESVTIKRDATPPSATATRGPLPNQYGWNKTNVTVSFSGTDALSGAVTCSPQIVLSADGPGQSASGRCFDAAGNGSAAATVSGINIDKSAPTIQVNAPANNSTYRRNELVAANYTCGDTLSGIDTCIGTVANGQSIDTSKKSGKFTVNASDRAGNSAKQTINYSTR
jgi:hypothetical protein